MQRWRQIFTKTYRLMYLLNIQGIIIRWYMYASNINWKNKNFIKPHSDTKGKSTVDTISHIVDKIKIRETTYVLWLFVDFSGAFDCMSWSRHFSLFKERPRYQLQIPTHNSLCNLQWFSFEDREILIRTPECIARKKINRECP